MSTTVQFTRDKQARILRDWLEETVVWSDADTIKLPLREAISECLRRDETELGMSLIALISLRSDGRERRAAELLWGLLASRRR